MENSKPHKREKTDYVYVGFADNTAIVKVIGRGTMEFCPRIQDKLNDLINKSQIKEVIFDLSEADYIDSTFIGTIVTLDKKLKEKFNTHAYIYEPSERVDSILNSMDLKNYIKFVHKLPEFERMWEIAKTERENIDFKMIYNVHEKLMEVSDKAREKFKLFMEQLKEEIEERERREKE